MPIAHRVCVPERIARLSWKLCPLWVGPAALAVRVCTVRPSAVIVTEMGAAVSGSLAQPDTLTPVLVAVSAVIAAVGVNLSTAVRHGNVALPPYPTLYAVTHTVWLPSGVKPDEVAYYVQLMKKVQATPEWKEYLEKTQQTGVFETGADLQKLIKEDLERTRKIGAEQGWLTGR